MAKPAHVRLVFEGVIGTVVAPIEHWSFGLNFPAATIPTDSPDATLDDLIAEHCADHYYTNILPLMGTDVRITGTKISHVLADGHVATRADGSYVQGEWNGDGPGTAAAVAMPLQTALCVSLTTARAGATGKGRFFLPWPSLALDVTSKRLTEAQATTVADAAVAFLNGVATETTYPAQVVSSKGYMSEVTGVRVGRAPDTMRSRREDLPEGYVALPLA